MTAPINLHPRYPHGHHAARPPADALRRLAAAHRARDRDRERFDPPLAPGDGAGLALTLRVIVVSLAAGGAFSAALLGSAWLAG